MSTVPESPLSRVSRVALGLAILSNDTSLDPIVRLALAEASKTLVIAGNDMERAQRIASVASSN